MLSRKEMIPYFERARELIREGYTKETFARNSAQAPVDEMHKDAVCYCAVGALRKAVAEKHGYEWDDEMRVSLFGPEAGMVLAAIYEQTNAVIGNGVENGNVWNITRYNDYYFMSQGDIISLFDRCIQSCQTSD